MGPGLRSGTPERIFGIQWKKASQLSVPKASHEANAITTAVMPALTNTRHCPATISAIGNSSPYCGLYVNSPRQMPASTGRIGIR